MLYPGASNQCLESLPEETRPRRLAVIDGTWSQAHRIYRDCSWLHGLPRYGLRPNAASRYRIRKEPRPECLSTLESVVLALSVLEPETNALTELIDAFDLMNERQLEFMHRGDQGSPRKKQRPKRPSRAIPEIFWSSPERIVIVQAESAQIDTRTDPKRSELSQWSAVRLTEPQMSFDGVLQPSRGSPDEGFLEQLRWPQDALTRAESLRQIRLRWGTYTRPKDVFVSWNALSLRMGADYELIDRPALSLKGLYGNTTFDPVGALGEVVEREGLQPKYLPPVLGRAALRLAQAHAMALYLGRWGALAISGRHAKLRLAH